MTALRGAWPRLRAISCGSLRQKTVHGGSNAPPLGDDFIHEREHESFAVMDTVLVPRASAALLL
jgi:hypothetical protein